MAGLPVTVNMVTIGIGKWIYLIFPWFLAELQVIFRDIIRSNNCEVCGKQTIGDKTNSIFEFLCK